MAYTTINKGSSYFNTVLYTGNGATQSITGVGFQPDFCWLKQRNNPNAYTHQLYDVVRGVTNYILTSSTAAEVADANGLTAFGVDGFSIGSGVGINDNGINQASWNWLANGAGVSNTAGTLTSTVSANQTAGFSIVTYTATSGVSSIGHGLGVAPSMIILKTRNQSGNWITGLSVNGWDKYLIIDGISANTTDRRMFSPTAGTDPTSTLFWSDQAAIGSAGTMVAYCFADIKGYSKFGSYTGNGSADGTFIYTGFKPAFVIVKATSTTGYWLMKDNKRANSFNPSSGNLYPNVGDSEDTNPIGNVDLLSNGFKLRGTYPAMNGSGQTNIYMAFAENPFVTSGGIPVTAR